VKLPGAEDVRIDQHKVRGYLLSSSHPLGASKARLFAALGFNQATSGTFVAELRRIARTQEVSETVTTPFGQKYMVPGLLSGALGSRRVVTIWLVEPGQKRARLVTVRPR
jgi:hypothetical protein